MRSLDVAVYRGKRDQNTCSVTVDGKPLDRRLDVVSVPIADFEVVLFVPSFFRDSSQHSWIKNGRT